MVGFEQSGKEATPPVGKKAAFVFREWNDPGTNTLLPLGAGEVPALLGFSMKSPVLVWVCETGRVVLSL
jgi:hypothetical protein